MLNVSLLLFCEKPGGVFLFGVLDLVGMVSLGIAFGPCVESGRKLCQHILTWKVDFVFVIIKIKVNVAILFTFFVDFDLVVLS